MSLVLDTIDWLGQYAASGRLAQRLAEHLALTVVSMVVACLIAVPIGYLIGHTGKGREIAVGISGAARALPSFGLILLLISLVGVLQRPLAAIVAFVILAIPSVLAGAYSGLQAIDRSTVDAARAIGMTEWQILWKVEVPLGLHLLLSGIRSGTLQVVATVTLAAYIGLGGLGYDILQGLPLRRDDQVFGAAIIVIILAFAFDALFGVATHIVDRLVPHGTPDRRRRLRAPSTGSGAAVEPTTPS
jgi:osmoprotectant transport system permease protein